MKKYIIKGLLFGTALVTVVSCKETDGALYSGAADKISFFSKTTNLPMQNGVLDIPVGRTSSAGGLELPISLTAKGRGYTSVFQLVGPVTFENGQAKSYAQVSYGDFSSLDPSSLSIATAAGKDVNVGLAFPFTLKIAADDVSVSKFSTIDVLASSQLVFDNPVSVNMNSVDGWAEEDLTVNVQKAKGANVYKIRSPFGENSIAFMIRAAGDSIVFPDQVIGNDPSYGPISMTKVKGAVNGKVVTIEVGAYSVSAGSFGSGVEIIQLP